MRQNNHAFNIASILMLFCINTNMAPVEDLFSPYRLPTLRDSTGGIIPPSPNYGFPESFFRWQQMPEDHDGKTKKIKISVFPTKHRTISEQFVIDASGISSARTLSDSGGAGEGVDYHLDKKTLTQLDALLSNLPPSAVGPPLDRLICVSYMVPGEPNKWKTLIYDTQQLPENVNKLLDLSGFNRITSYGRRKLPSERPKLPQPR